MRKTREELQELCDKLKVDTLWSFSRYDTYKTDRWEYFLKYILKEKEDNSNGIYCVAGNVAHGILEDLYLGRINYVDMLSKYEDELFSMECAELKYNSVDEEKNEAIQKKYEACMRHFFKHHQIVCAPYRVEKFILIKITEDIYFHGYADFTYTEERNGKTYIHVVDYKTSTKYTGASIEAHEKQLLLYAEGIRQTLKIPIENIICEWNFLKYTTVSIEQKNGNIKQRHIERNSIGESLANVTKTWLKSYGYSNEDIAKYVEEMIFTNSTEVLPQEIQDKFIFSDCYIQITLNNDKIDELKEDIIKTIKEIKNKEKVYSEKKDESVFWQEVTSADEYRLYNLSGYSRKLHKPFDEYLKDKEMFLDNEPQSNDDELLDFLNQL